jgi:hypothetical protein
VISIIRTKGKHHEKAQLHFVDVVLGHHGLVGRVRRQCREGWFPQGRKRGRGVRRRANRVRTDARRSRVGVWPGLSRVRSGPLLHRLTWAERHLPVSRCRGKLLQWRHFPPLCGGSVLCRFPGSRGHLPLAGRPWIALRRNQLPALSTGTLLPFSCSWGHWLVPMRRR